jgi:hypothetical protein
MPRRGAGSPPLGLSVPVVLGIIAAALVVVTG